METKEQAEIQQLNSEAERNKAEEKKLELETLELQKRLNQKWFSGRVFIEATIGGVVGAALLAAWLIGYFNPILSAKHELVRLENSRLAVQIEKERENNERVREHLEKQRQQHKSQLKKFAAQNEELQKALEGAEKHAKTLKIQLQNRIEQYKQLTNSQATESEQKAYEKLASDAKAEIAQLKSHIQSLQTEKEATKARAAQVSQQIGNLGNARYIIAVYGLNALKEKYEAINQYFNEEGYRIDRGYNYSTRQDWLALNSTVFFYHKETKTRANEIAEKLTKITGSKFNISIGAGYGVGKGEEKWTVFVHYIPK